MYLTDEIDEGATRRKLDEIMLAGLHALDEHAERSAQIDGEFRAALDRQQAEARAMDQLVADAHAKREADQAGQDQPGPWAKREAKPTVLSLGGDEFVEPAATVPVPQPVPPAAPALPAPPGPPEPPAPPPPPGDRVHVLSLGYAGEDGPPQERTPPAPPAAPPPVPPPAARRESGRHARPDDDDDLSGRSWMH